jgi:hypothetical protein
MLSSPRPNLVESDAGFSVEVLGRVGMRYREGQKSLFVDSEVLSAGHGIMILAKSIRKWDSPHDEEPIAAEKKAAIIANITQVLVEFWKQPIEVR